MACGVPVVAYDLPRTRWILGDQGCLSATENAEDIAHQIELAFLQRGAGESTLTDRASRFDWASIADRYRDFLEQVVEQS
jgi:glycosyltransferase involved in cell wall biosynthesis